MQWKRYDEPTTHVSTYTTVYCRGSVTQEHTLRHERHLNQGTPWRRRNMRVTAGECIPVCDARSKLGWDEGSSARWEFNSEKRYVMQQQGEHTTHHLRLMKRMKVRREADRGAAKGDNSSHQSSCCVSWPASSMRKETNNWYEWKTLQ